MKKSYQEKAEQGMYVDAVAEFVRVLGGGVSFVELQEMLSPYMDVSGDYGMPLPGYENIILWVGMSQEFYKAVAEALRSHRIECHPTQVMVYLVDGVALKMPLAKSAIQYKEPHWLPVAFNVYVPEPSTKKPGRAGKRKK